MVSGWPDTVSIGGRPVAIETGFRTWLQITRCLADPGQTGASKAAHLVMLSGIGEATPEAIRALLSFARCGEKPSGRRERTYDVDQDAWAIVASFLQQYGIDLTSAGTQMHWHMFCALLKGLGDDTPLMRLIRLRTMELPAGNDEQTRKRREQIARAQRDVRLAARTAEERAALDARLWGD